MTLQGTERNGKQMIKRSEPSIGATMQDGTIYAGMSLDTGYPMFARAAEAPLTLSFNGAKQYTTRLDAHGHQDWRVPTKAELNLLFNNRAAIGGFDMSGDFPAGWYWSSTQSDSSNARCQRFSDGDQLNYPEYPPSSVRCVRDAAPVKGAQP